MKKLLSREPTPEMVEAMKSIHTTLAISDLVGIFKLAWDAAPALPEPGEIEKFLRETAQKWRDLGAETDAVFNENAADLIAALSAKKELPEPVEVEQNIRFIAEQLLPKGLTPFHDRIIEAADLIAAQDSTIADLRESIVSKRDEDFRILRERAEKSGAERDSAKRDAEHFFQLSGKYLEQKNALEAENKRLLDKALSYDLDQAGIKQREAEAIELVELKAANERLLGVIRLAHELAMNSLDHAHPRNSASISAIASATGAAIDAAKEKP